MNSKERLLKALSFEETDRPPNYPSFTMQAAEKMYRHFVMEPSKPLDSPMSSLRISDLLMKLGVDCICVASRAPDNVGPVDFAADPRFSVIVGQYIWGDDNGEMGGIKGLDFKYKDNKPIELN
jgi:hypothetical protein